MRKSTILTLSLLLQILAFHASGQIQTRIAAGQIQLAGSTPPLSKTDYVILATQLDKKLKIDPKDTTTLLDRALLYLQDNSLLAKTYPEDKAALTNLSIAKEMAEMAITLHMHDFKLKVLRAQIYKELCYRFAGDESWKYNADQIAKRRCCSIPIKNWLISIMTS